MNDPNEIIHLLVTTLCDRNCKHCCNKQMDMNSIPQVTNEELDKAKMVLLTGGEPIIYANVDEIANKLKIEHPNIEKVIVYANAKEFLYAVEYKDIYFSRIDGVSLSIKNRSDLESFEHLQLTHYYYLPKNLKSNRLYVFDGLMPKNTEGFEVFEREWQSKFEPCPDSIFRRI